MTIPPKKAVLFDVPDASDAAVSHPRRPEAAIPGTFENPPSDAPGNTFAYPFGVDPDEGVVPGAPGYEAATPLDPQLPDNKFPHESGSDTYSGIPGDGIVEG